jgi:microcystin-dependent protein
MAVTYIDHAGTQGQTDFTFTFPYLEDEHIKVEIDGVDTTDFTVVATPTAKIVLDTGLSAAAAVRVRRRSAPNENLVDFVNGSVLTEAELDLSYRHNRYLAEEIAELNDQSLQIENGGTEWDAKTKRIKNVGTAVDSTDAVTKVYLDNKVAQVSTGATQPPLKWVFSATSGTNNTYTVTGAEVLGDTAYEVSIDGLIKEPTVEYTVNPSTDTLTIIPNMTGGEDIVVIQRGFGVAVAGTVDTNSLVDGSVTNTKLATNSVSTDKIQDNAITSGKTNFNELLVTNESGSARIEIGSATQSYLDLGSLSSVDYDGRLWIEGNAGALRVIGKHGLDFRVGTINPTTVATLNQSGDLNITGDYKVNGTNLQTVPTGTVSAFAGSAAPTGYALCDGSAVNRTAQAALFSVIGTTYGIGDGSTTFNLPDLRGRVVAGLGESLLGATADTLGEDNGLIADTKEHTLIEAEMPSHSHTASWQVETGSLAYPGFDGSGNQMTSANTTATGGNQPHNNVQPTIILNYIIKT